MRITVEVSDAVVERARSLSGIVRISDLVREGLQALIARESRKRLISYGGSDPAASAPNRPRRTDEVAEPHDPR